MENIYLDNAATTKICEEALNEFVECENNYYANSSSLHEKGQKTAGKLEEARDEIALLIGASPDEIYFTCGATESNNICLRGYAQAKDKNLHIITTEVEHPAVLNTAKDLEAQGYKVTYLSVDENCNISLDELKNALSECENSFVSIMHTNNEVGVINPIDEIARLVHEYGGVYHCDAVQAMGKLPIDVKKSEIDMLSASAHKFHGPKGIGFMYIRKGIKLNPIIFGGEQERDMRPGTVNTSAISAMATALKKAYSDNSDIKSLQDRLIEGIKNNIPNARLNAENANRIYCIVNFAFPKVTPDQMLYALDRQGLCVSAGSACSAGSLEISHVIKAMGADKYGAPVRFSLSRFTTEDEIDRAVEITKKVYNKLLK